MEANKIKKTVKKKAVGSKKNKDSCCAEEVKEHPSHIDLLPSLRRVQGQLNGVERMITERRYCVDILVQFKAALAALRAVEVEVFETHLHHCVSTSLRSRDTEEIEKKIKEITDLLKKRSVL